MGLMTVHMKPRKLSAIPRLKISTYEEREQFAVPDDLAQLAARAVGPHTLFVDDDERLLARRANRSFVSTGLLTRSKAVDEEQVLSAARRVRPRAPEPLGGVPHRRTWVTPHPPTPGGAIRFHGNAHPRPGARVMQTHIDASEIAQPPVSGRARQPQELDLPGRSRPESSRKAHRN